MKQIRNQLVFAFAISLIASLLSSPSRARSRRSRSPVFGDNQIDDYLNSAGFSATLVTDANLSTAGFLDVYDAFSTPETVCPPPERRCPPRQPPTYRRSSGRPDGACC